MTHAPKLLVYTDGASRSNPGHAACGYLVKQEGERPFRIHFEYLGPKVTNNVAEYRAVANALCFLTELTTAPGPHTAAAIEIRSDSQLVVEQLNGRWKVKDTDLRAIWTECQEHLRTLRTRACAVQVQWIPREQNSEADKHCNQALDAALH